jgi:hypothetical protein
MKRTKIPRTCHAALRAMLRDSGSGAARPAPRSAGRRRFAGAPRCQRRRMLRRAAACSCVPGAPPRGSQGAGGLRSRSFVPAPPTRPPSEPIPLGARAPAPRESGRSRRFGSWRKWREIGERAGMRGRAPVAEHLCDLVLAVLPGRGRCAVTRVVRRSQLRVRRGAAPGRGSHNCSARGGALRARQARTWLATCPGVRRWWFIARTSAPAARSVLHTPCATCPKGAAGRGAWVGLEGGALSARWPPRRAAGCCPCRWPRSDSRVRRAARARSPPCPCSRRGAAAWSPTARGGKARRFSTHCRV